MKEKRRISRKSKRIRNEMIDLANLVWSGEEIELPEKIWYRIQNLRSRIKGMDDRVNNYILSKIKGAA